MWRGKLSSHLWEQFSRMWRGNYPHMYVKNSVECEEENYLHIYENN